MSINNNHHQNNTGNRYYGQSSYNQASMNLYQPTAGLPGSTQFNLLANNQGQTGGYSLTNLNQSAGYQSHFALNQQVNIPQLNQHQGNSILSGPSGINPNTNILISQQHSRAYSRPVPPLPGQVQTSQNALGPVLKSQSANIQKRKNEVELDVALDNLPSSQKKIKTENIQILDTLMNIESESKVPANFKIYELSQYEISKEIDEKIQNTKKILEDIPKVKPNYISLQSCEASKLQVDLFRIKYIFSDQFLIAQLSIYSINRSQLANFSEQYVFLKNSLIQNSKMNSGKIFLKIRIVLIIYKIDEHPFSKSQKRVYCLVEDIQRLMNVLKLDKELEAKQNEKNNPQSISRKDKKKKNEENKKIIKRGPGRRKKIADDNEQMSDKSFIEEDGEEEDSHSRGESDNESNSQSTSALQKKKVLKQRTKKKRGTQKKILNDQDESSEDQNSDSDEEDDEQDSTQNDQMEQESSQQPIKKKRILKRKKSLVSDDSSGKNYEEMLDEGLTEKNKNQDDSGEKVKNKRGRKLLQKNKLSKGKNKNAIESDDEEQSFSLNKKGKVVDDQIENENTKIGRKLIKNKLQIDDDEEKSDTTTQQPQKQEEPSQTKIPSVVKSNVKTEDKLKIETEEEQQQEQDQQIKIEQQNLDTDIKVEEKIEHTDIQQEVKQEIDIKIENKLLKVKEREQNHYNRYQELEKRQKYLYEQQQKLFVSILEQKHAASNLEIVNKHVSIS